MNTVTSTPTESTTGAAAAPEAAADVPVILNLLGDDQTGATCSGGSCSI